MLNTEQGRTGIQPHQSQVIGCRFIEHYDPDKQKMFWEEVLDQGLPIALGIRHLEIIGMTKEKSIQQAKKSMEVVTRNCSIMKLPESLSAERQKVLSQKYESEIEQLKKSRLCLLWDNPFRRFPTIEYQSE